ncbi:MAG: thymidine kinase [Rubripirellula sp.]
MAKLYFYYSSMNAGKSTILLQSSYNYRERGMQTLILSPELDDRFQVGKVTSRIGIEADALTFTISDNLLKMVLRVSEQDKIACVLVEVKTICHCGSKATMVLRIDADGRAIKDGRQVQIGGNERYLSVCRRHFKAGVPSADSEPHSGSSEDLLF